jgi:2-oxo-4-hydroxy-4-carboxy-5-ureidoimidazoline decarboxylase
LDHALAQLNSLPATEARQEFLKCCGSQNWAGLMVASRPFKDLAELLNQADRNWWSLTAVDWLDAFRSHPKIGEQKAAEKVTEQARNWSAAEQAGTRDAAQETTEALAAGNREYEQRFGYIFIVCASGKSAAEMLAILRERLNNDPDAELRVAAEEQSKITHLRLKKLIESLESGV